MASNSLYYGDNLDILRRYVQDESVDLIYLDPPFKSDQTYNVLFQEKDGSQSASQIKAFEDTWHWDETAARSYEETVEAGGQVAEAMRAFRMLLGPNDMLAYLSMMAPRLVELRRVLKPTGSLYLHCDSTASHYLKILLDAVFGPVNFRNEIIWRRTGAHGAQRSFGPIHDTILFYSKTPDYFFRIAKGPYMRGHVDRRYTKDDEGRLKFTSGGNVLTGAGATQGESGQSWRGFNPSKKNRHWAVPGFLSRQMPPEFMAFGVLKKLDVLYEKGLIDIKDGAAWPTPVRFLNETDGHPLQDIWAYQPYTDGTVHGTKDGIDEDVKWLGPTDPERVGYQTQKPLGLLDRIIRSSCPDDGLVLDPFCGCGTTIATAQKLDRRWIGIDITQLAISLIRYRLRDSFGKDCRFGVIGEPTSLPDATALAELDPYQFQWWALGLVRARPVEQKKGADQGIDGRLYFHDEGKGGKTKQIIFSVKAGKVTVSHIRDLVGVISREKAQIGAFLSLEPPTSPMRKEAASAGFYKSPWGKHPRIQLLTIEDLLGGKSIDYPQATDVTFKKARRVRPNPLEKQKILPMEGESPEK